MTQFALVRTTDGLVDFVQVHPTVEEAARARAEWTDDMVRNPENYWTVPVVVEDDLSGNPNIDHRTFKYGTHRQTYSVIAVGVGI